ncbi:hypothetical protein ACFSJY_03375 [Thalassotalea euphylliae]|uniref:hypothetical protein n=1 Tax=Thalassotalea euphylliae TaxID=1655234 RepID=UPI00363165E2
MLKSLFKWISIAAIALAVIALILLGVGYILSKNEKETRALKDKLDERAIAESKVRTRADILSGQKSISRNPLPPQPRKPTLRLPVVEDMLAKQVITNNLVCQDVSQCELFDTGRTSLGCVVAVNGIGLSQLNRLNFGGKETECEETITNVQATCHHNICSIK